jgi:DNA-binding beta-propeller fold protein YncE
MRPLPLGLATIAAAAVWGPAQASLLFMGAYPNSLIVFDEAKGKVVQRIPLATGLPTSLRASSDKKTIYVTTITNSGIEVLDVATRKVTNKFSLNTPGKRYRFNGGAPDPTGKLFYTVITQIDKGVDRFEVSKPKYAVIDLVQQKVVATYEVAKEDEEGARGYRSSMLVSDDGKYLYQFRDKVIVLDTKTFKVVERIDLAKPEAPGLEGVSFGAPLDAISEPGRHVSLFNGTDPHVHNRVFGVARFNLSNREFQYTPIGPAPGQMAGLEVTPDGKQAYTVVTNGVTGNKRCEIWRFSMSANTLQQKSEFPCKSRFTFGMSGNGKKLYMYGASFEIDVYDARSLKFERTWDLQNDITGAGLVIIP